jgi:hypothetical protein
VRSERYLNLQALGKENEEKEDTRSKRLEEQSKYNENPIQALWCLQSPRLE